MGVAMTPKNTTAIQMVRKKYGNFSSIRAIYLCESQHVPRQKGALSRIKAGIIFDKYR